MMPSPGHCAFKFLRSNLRRGAKPKVRIAVLGQASVGKTALIVRYCTRRFIVDYSPEVSKVYSHQATLDHEEVAMDIWDTAGHFQLSLSEAELRHLEVFVRWADVLVLVYSVTDRTSFSLALQLLEHIRPRPTLNKGGRQHPQRGLSLDNSSSHSSSGGSGKDLMPTATGGASCGAGAAAGLFPMREALPPGFEPCENCPDLPIVLVGTKSDLHLDRQVRSDAGHAAAGRFGCAKFKEISTRESIDDVAEVFEHSCRQGWLFRQHRELTKHRTMSILPVPPNPSGVSSAPASATGAAPNMSSSGGSSFEKSISLDSSSTDWWEPASASGNFGASSSSPTGQAAGGGGVAGAVGVGGNVLGDPGSAGGGGGGNPTSGNGGAGGPGSARRRKLSLQPFSHASLPFTMMGPPSQSSAAGVMGRGRKSSSGSITGILSNIKKCITPAGRPLFHSLPASQAPYPPPPGSSNTLYTPGTSAPCPSPCLSHLSAAEEEERRRLHSEAAMAAATNDGKGHHSANQPPPSLSRRFFRSRANTDSGLCAHRIRSLSLSSGTSGASSAHKTGRG